MGMKILVISVGGSCAPLITSILQNRPDKVFFVCSDDTKNGSKGSYDAVIGRGLVCGKDWSNPDQPNIVSQTNLSEDQYVIIKLKYIDDHNFCYSKSLDLLKDLRRSYPNAEIIVDYTGGTKSMTVGLVMAAADIPDITIAIVKGERSNLLKVDDGTQRVKLSRTNYSLLTKQKQIAESFTRTFDYASAVDIINSAFSSFADIPREIEDEFQKIHVTCQAFDKWDKFQHGEAKRILERDRKSNWKLVEVLNQIIECKKFLIEDIPLKNATGYEVVKDLILNAERRALQNKYDDAVARLYRALELIGQVYLKSRHQINTEKVELSKLPEKVSSALFPDSKEKEESLPLFKAFNLIEKLDEINEGEFGPLFTKNKKRIMNSLQVRNKSILAHGFRRVSESDYKKVYESFVDSFISPLLTILSENKKKKVDQEQFPRESLLE